MDRLTIEEINAALEQLPDWHLENNTLQRTFTFTNFSESMSFVNHVASLAEALGHHPDIDIRYSVVRLALSTHDAGGITTKDTQLARSVTAIL